MNLVKGLKQCHCLPKDHLPSLNQSGTELYLLVFCFVFDLEMTNVQRLEKTQGTEKLGFIVQLLLDICTRYVTQCNPSVSSS